MSDILIKGMEMPDKCGHCRFANAFDCAVTGSFISTHSIRQPDCPLVPVSQHGKLIDADLIMDKLKKNCKIVFGDDDDIPECSGLSIVADYIESAPTIIPASEEGET